MTKPYSGVYKSGSTTAIYVFDDGTFALIGYATLLFGHYTHVGNEVQFEVEQPTDAFVVLGRQNPQLGSRAKLTFNSVFAQNTLYIQFDKGMLTPVFDKTTNVLRPYHKAEIATTPKQITLVEPIDTAEDEETAMYNRAPQKSRPNSNTFVSPPAFNDFLILYNEPEREMSFFEGQFAMEDGQPVLVMGSDTFEKDEDDKESLAFIMQAKASRKVHKNDSMLYFNTNLKSATGYDELSEEANRFKVSDYVLDKASNKLIRKDAYKKGASYANAVAKDYHDERIILQYKMVTVSHKAVVPIEKGKMAKSSLLKAEPKQ